MVLKNRDDLIQIGTFLYLLFLIKIHSFTIIMIEQKHRSQ